jgi:hypothetical protein
MTYVGFILLIAGGIIALLNFIGITPAPLEALPVPFWAWLVVAAVGAALIVLNRRPGD